MTEKKAGICNAKKRKNLVTFNWRISQDWVVKSFKWYIAEQHLKIPTWRIQPRWRVKWPKTIELSPYMYRVIEAECKKRWPKAAPPAAPAEPIQVDATATPEPANVAVSVTEGVSAP